MLKNSTKFFWRFIRHLFWFSLWLFALGFSLAYATRWWPGDSFFGGRLINYFMPWFLLGLLPALLIAGLGRRYGLAGVLGLPTLLIGLFYAPLFLPQSNTAIASDTPLKVMSYNVLYRNQTLDQAIDLIQQEQPDILLLQEVTPYIALTFQPALDNLYPGQPSYYAYDLNIGQVVVSRYPIRPLDSFPEQGRTQKVLIEIPGGPIQVWNVHPTTPLAWSRQYRQISQLAEAITAVPGPLIVGGDFNTTEHSITYRLVNQHLNNAHWEAGWGFGFSFPAHTPRVKGLPVVTPMVRIDHIFYSDHFFARQARTLPDSGGSDHYPVIAELSLVQ